MIKSIKPGHLAGLSDAQIAERLTAFLGAYVQYMNYEAHIYTVEDYANPEYLVRALDRIRRVGDVSICCDRRGPYVRLVFNEIARDVISGARAKRDAEKRSSFSENTQ